MNRQPDPADLLMGMVDAQFSERAFKLDPYRPIRVRVPVHHYSLVTQAADLREMSNAAYSRRALFAFVAYDLGRDVMDLLADEPPIRLAGESPTDARSEAGTGHGLWRIGGLI